MHRDRFFFLSPDLLATAGVEGYFLELNPAWTRCLGWTLDELRARPWIEFVHPDDVARTLAVRDTVGDEDVVHFENRFRHRDGSYRWLAWSASRQIEGIAYLIARDVTQSKSIEAALRASTERIGRDISDRKHIEAELRARSEQLREEAEISAALARVGSELLSSVATPGLLQRLARLTAEAVGCEASNLFLWDQQTETFVAMASHGATAEQREMARATRFPLSIVGPLHEPLDRGEVVHAVRSQVPALVRERIFEPFDVNALLMCALRRGDALIGTLSAVNRTREAPFTAQQQRILQGIAQLGSFALENARLFEELERANRFRSEFIATMSHELRTPMTVILGYHELLLDGTFGALTTAQADTVQRANRSAAELLDVVNATLDLSRLETRHIPLTLVEVTAQRLLDDVAAEIVVPPGRTSLRLVWQPAPEGLVLHTDLIKMRMVLKNLVGNAIKYTERGQVTVAACAQAGGVQFTISDTGIGIAPEAQDYIFEPFRQVDGTNGTHAGAGLGLYIVRRLLEALGGTITLDSALGQGSTFRVWLPRRRRDRPRA